MNPKKILFYSLLLAYLVGLAQQFGIVVGLYLSLLVLSFFILLTPLVAYVGTCMALFSRGDALRAFQNWAVGAWITLFVLNIVTLTLFPIIYSKTAITMFVHHMFLVPMAGGVPVMVTGVSVVYYWLAARYTSSWTRFVVCLLGAVGCSVAFHMFMKGFYFAQFVASLNTSALNY